MKPALAFGRDAFTLDAIVSAGVPPSVARTLMADGPNAVPMKPRLSVKGRKRGLLTTNYIWGPDANVLLAERRSAA